MEKAKLAKSAKPAKKTFGTFGASGTFGFLIYWGWKIRTSVHGSKGRCAAAAPIPNDKRYFNTRTTNVQTIVFSFYSQ